MSNEKQPADFSLIGEALSPDQIPGIRGRALAPEGTDAPSNGDLIEDDNVLEDPDDDASVPAEV